MGPDDEICLCFHVTRRKVENFLRVERPRRVGQLSECFGAGTGCGWCRPFLRRLYDAAQDRGELPELRELTPEEYSQQRVEYRERQATEPPSQDGQA